MRKEEKELSILMNALDRQDLISGFGKKELKLALAVFCVCLIGCIVAVSQNDDNMIFAIMITVGIMATLLFMVWRDQYDESMVEKVRQVFAYAKLQKKYEYHYDDWLAAYTGEVENEENSRANDGQ